MTIVADTHIHLYGCYDTEKALLEGFQRLRATGGSRAGESPSYAFLLTEGVGHHVFKTLRDGTTTFDSFGVEETAEPEALKLTGLGDETVYLYAGRQVVTYERLEVLALTTDADIPDGQAIGQAIEGVRSSGGIPVLGWSPGKWFFHRGRIVMNIIDRATPGALAIGDTTLRPTIWGEPQLMGTARRQGLKVLAGSDPLPFPGEEQYIGTYASIIEGVLDPDAPVSSLRALLSDPETAIRIAGTRPPLHTVLGRLKKNRDVKRGT